MKKLLALMLAAALALSLAACGGQNSTAGGDAGSAHTPPKSDIASSAENSSTPAEKLSMEDSELYLVSAGGGLVAVAFHGPENIEGYFFNNTTNKPYGGAIVGRTYLGNGWSIYMKRTQDPDAVDDPIDASILGMTITNVSPYDEGVKEKTFTSLGRQLTAEELKDMGLLLYGEHFGIVSGGSSYGRNNFTLETRVTWLDTAYAKEYWNHSADESEVNELMERMTFFTEDGTPLSEYFSSYTMETKVNSYDNIWSYFYTDLTKDENKQMISELKSCKPYMVYTYDDGTTQQFQLFRE